MQNFRRLHVWERAHQFALDVRIATESFPRSGYSELRRSSYVLPSPFPQTSSRVAGHRAERNSLDTSTSPLSPPSRSSTSFSWRRTTPSCSRTGGNPFRAR